MIQCVYLKYFCYFLFLLIVCLKTVLFLLISQMNINPEDLIPKLPKPKDLQPFPTQLAIVSSNISST